ncbi:MAG: hypothetical protein KDA81_15715 [Planctomycetaceae bacterium]|nr:hypothetical protein [Planctomycetaceae bacterium]
MEWNEFLNQQVVVDVEAMYVFVGTLTAVSDKSLTLENVDVHDLRDSKTTREVYVHDSRIHGVRANRKKTFVAREQVVSLSLLSDVID